MSLGHGAKIVTDSLAFMFDTANSKSWKGKPVTNLVPAGQRTCSLGLSRMSAHVQSYTYESGVSYGRRKDVIKATITPTTTNPYADYGFQVSRSGGSQVGDIYWVSFEYINVKGGSDPSGVSTYANGYKNPSSASAGTLSDVSITELSDGWKRWSGKVTITIAGNTWWRFGQSSNSQDVEFYLDNFQIIHSDVYAPFVDGTRSNTEALLDISSAKRTITTPSFNYNANGDFSFSGDDILYTGLFSGRSTSSAFTVEAWIKSDITSGARMWVDVGGNGSSQRFYSSLIHPQAGNPMGIQGNGWSTSVPYDTNWHHQTIVMDGSTAKGYCDGELVHTKGYTSYNLPGSITIGGRSGYYWDGNISIVKIYEKALTEQEIKQNFEAHRARYGI